MFVTYKCESCGYEVNSHMESCPKCEVELPEMTLERDYDAEIDGELYELEHPIRTRVRKTIGPYFDHLLDVVIQEAEIEEAAEAEHERIKEEEGKKAARWHSFKNSALKIFIAFGIIAYIIMTGVLIDYIEDERTAYVTWGVLALIPLYGISLWLLVGGDNREVPLKQKMLQHALGAFNKLIFGILYVGLAFFIITSINKFLFQY